MPIFAIWEFWINFKKISYNYKVWGLQPSWKHYVNYLLHFSISSCLKYYHNYNYTFLSTMFDFNNYYFIFVYNVTKHLSFCLKHKFQIFCTMFFVVHEITFSSYPRTKMKKISIEYTSSIFYTIIVYKYNICYI